MSDITTPSPGSVRFHRRLTLPVIALVALSLGAIAGLVVWAAREQDSIALAQEQRFVAFQVGTAREHLGQIAKDFSWYDLAIEKLFTSFDARFAEDTMGAYLARQHGIDAVIVLDRYDRVAFMALDGRPADPARVLEVGDGFTGLLETARAAPANEPIPVTGFVRFGPATWMVAASAYTPGYNNGRVKPNERGVLVVAKMLDAGFVAEVLNPAIVADGTFIAADGPGPAVAHDVRGLDGALLGFLAWTPSGPGGQVVGRAALPLGLAAVTILGLLAVFLRYSHQAVRRLEADADALARRSAELAESDNRQRAVFERVADAVLTANAEGRVVSCNPAGARLFGIATDSLLTRHVDELLTRDGGPSEAVPLLEDIASTAAEHTGIPVSLMARRRDGSHAVVEASAARVDLGEDHIYALVLRDVTERHRAEETLNLLATGTIVVTRGARVLLANRSAERALAKGQSLTIAGGRLRATTPWHDQELQTLIDTALGAGARETMAGVGVMNIVMPGDTRPLHLIVSPLHTADGGTVPSAAIIVRDPDAQTSVHPAFLRRLYGLTRAEARVVAELAKGKRLQEVADELRISLNTVRNQLKQAFTKTSTNRQSDLVSLVLTSVADLNLDPPANEPGQAPERGDGRPDASAGT